jgi:hypothetical protein
MQFIARVLAGEDEMTVLCREYGASRKTGYKWLGRYIAEGAAGLAERSHAPLQHGQAHDVAVVQEVLDLRQRWAHWGPKKGVPESQPLASGNRPGIEVCRFPEGSLGGEFQGCARHRAVSQRLLLDSTRIGCDVTSRRQHPPTMARLNEPNDDPGRYDQQPRRSRANLRPPSRSASAIDRLLKNQHGLENGNNLRPSSPHRKPRRNFAVRNSWTQEP